MKTKKLLQVNLFEEVVRKVRHDAIDRGVNVSMLVEGILRKFYGMEVGEYLAVENRTSVSKEGSV
mgnify:CR=1 FL=1